MNKKSCGYIWYGDRCGEPANARQDAHQSPKVASLGVVSRRTQLTGPKERSRRDLQKLPMAAQQEAKIETYMYRYQTNEAFEKLQNTVVRPSQSASSHIFTPDPVLFRNPPAHGRCRCQAGPALPVFSLAAPHLPVRPE